MFYKFARVVMRILIKVVYRIRFVGLEHVPQRGGYMIVCNHQSYSDPILLGIRLKQHLYFMAKAELFDHKLLGVIIKGLGAFPVNRGRGDTSAIDKSVALLGEGKVLAIFPEGTRSKTGEPLRPKSGAAVIAQQTGADVLPCAIVFGKRRWIRKPATVYIGELIPNALLQADEQSPAAIKEATRLIWDRVLALWEAGHACR